MSAITTSLITFACVFVAALFGMRLRRMLPDHHFSLEAKETVKLAMGFVATMSALILGLLVASAKDAYDQQATGVTQLAAKIVYLDRILANFGPETKDIRATYRQMVENVAQRMWSTASSDGSRLDPSALSNERLFKGIDALKPTTDLQTTLKAQAVSTSFEVAQLRWLEYEQAGEAASLPLICILVFWTSILFASFGMFAPKNSTVVAALALAALSVAGAIFLMLELRSPFSGMLQIPQTAFIDAMTHLGK